MILANGVGQTDVKYAEMGGNRLLNSMKTIE